MSLEIGHQIKKLREQQHLTGKELALRVGLSQSQMTRLEKGQRRVDTEMLAKISTALGVSPACFFADGPDQGAALTPRRERELSLYQLYGEIGKLIRSARRQRHMTVEDLARKTGATKAYVLAVEEGRRNGLDDGFLEKAFKLLALSPYEAFEKQEGVIHDLKVRIHQLHLALASGDDSDSENTRTPVLVGDESRYPREFDEDGQPVAAVESFVVLPDLGGRPSMALRVVGDEMTSETFEEGDVVVFVTDRQARSGEAAFVRYGDDQTTFRKVFHDKDPDEPGKVRSIRLQANRPEAPPIILDASDLKSAWPLAAHLRILQ